MTKVSDRLSKLREKRTPAGETPVQPKLDTGDFSMQRWFDKVRATPNAETVKSAAEFFDAAVRDGTQYVVPVGNLETLLLQHPGLQFYYRGVSVDAQQIRRFLEERLDRLEATKHNYYMYDEAARSEYGSLKTTEAAKLAKSDPAVLELSDLIRLMAFHEHNLERLMEAFDGIKYILNNVVTIRKEKLEEVYIDLTKETDNT